MRRAGALAGVLAAALAAGTARADPRSEERLAFDCRSQGGHREVTLFANGTIRVRTWDEGGHFDMRLAELAPAELAAYERRLAAEDLSEARVEGPVSTGAWTERCDLALTLGDQPPRRFRFGRLDALPLAVARLVGIAEELGLAADASRAIEGLPADYEPQHGDLLLRWDGFRYQIQGITSDGKAVELIGLDQPFTLYVAVEALRGEFRRLVERR